MRREDEEGEKKKKEDRLDVRYRCLCQTLDSGAACTARNALQELTAAKYKILKEY